MSGAHDAIIVAAELFRRRWMIVYNGAFFNDFGSVCFDQLAGRSCQSFYYRLCSVTRSAEFFVSRCDEGNYFYRFGRQLAA